jgi:hypothetical protein
MFKRKTKALGSNSRPLRIEQLESRSLLAGLETVAPPAALTVLAEADHLLHWYADVDGDSRPDKTFAFGWDFDNGGLGSDRPLVGDIDGDGYINAVIVRPQANGLLRWFVDTDGDPEAEYSFEFGFNSDRPLLGDLNRDRIADAVVVRSQQNGLLRWDVDTNRDIWAESQFVFGFNSDLPLLFDVDNDGSVNPIAVRARDTF